MRINTLLNKKPTKIILSLVLTLILILSNSVFIVSGSSTTEPQFKFKAKITGTVCEVWGTNPNRQEGDWVTMLATANKLPSAGNLTDDDIAYIDQFKTGTNGSFMLRFQLLTDRISSSKGHKKIYIIMNSEGCSVSNYLEVDVLPVTGTVSSVKSNSIRVGMDVYDASSTRLTEDNLLDSMKRGGNELYFKLGSYWYDLLDDKCVNSDWLVSSNALTTTEVNNLLWGQWYQSGSASPVYFK